MLARIVLGVISLAVIVGIAMGGVGLYDREHRAPYVFWNTEGAEVDTASNADSVRVIAYSTQYTGGDTAGHANCLTYTKTDSGGGGWHIINPTWDICLIVRDSFGAIDTLAENLLITGRALGDSVITDTTAFKANVVPAAAIVSVSGVTGADEDDVTLDDVKTACSNDFHEIGGTDDDVPESGDFGAGGDLEDDGTLSTGSVADNEIDYSAVTLGDFDYQTAWRVFYSDGSGDVTELALGSDGTYLKSNGASAAPTFATPGGAGDMMAADFDDSLNAQGFVNADTTGGPLATHTWTDTLFLFLAAFDDSIAVTASTELTDTADLLYEAELDAFSEIQTQIGDKTLINEEDVCTIDANWVNTASPWADNEVADNITASNYLLLTAAKDSVEANAYYPGGTDVADADVADDITVSSYVLLTAFGDSLVNYDGKGIIITDPDSIDVLVHPDGGIQISEDSLKVKLDGASLTSSASGLKVTDVLTLEILEDYIDGLLNDGTSAHSGIVLDYDDNGASPGAISCSLLVHPNGGMETSGDSIKVKLDGTTLALSASGLKFDTIPTGTDPDVDAAGEISNDSDGANETGDVSLRAYDGSNQFCLARKLDDIQFAVVKPQDFPDAQRDKLPVWKNKTGMTFTITSIDAIADVDDTAFTVEEYDADGASNQSDIDEINCTTGSGPYTDLETTISNPTIEAGHRIYIDFDDADDPGDVHIVISGWYNADVD